MNEGPAADMNAAVISCRQLTKTYLGPQPVPVAAMLLAPWWGRLPTPGPSSPPTRARVTSCLVQVRGEAVGNECVISVEDDGLGMEPEKAKAILAGRGSAGSVGLANVDRRLRNVYGPWFGLVVETEVGAGTRVVVRVPRFQPGVMP